MKISITIDGKTKANATLFDNQTARDFAALLPLTLDLGDFAGTEKASGRLPKKLGTDDAPAGHKPAAGDVTHYAPWNNLAIFYKSDKYAGGLVSIGRMDDDPAVLDIKGSVRVIIEKVN